jgi:hypothetical protein
VAHYEVEGAPEAAVAAVTTASENGRLRMSDSLCMDPPPVMRVLRLVTEYRPA